MDSELRLAKILASKIVDSVTRAAIERQCGIDALWEDCVDVDFSDAEDFGGAEDWQSLSADQSNWSETTGERDAWPEES